MGNVIFIILFAVGIYFLLIDLLGIPTYGSIKAIISVSKKDKTRESGKSLLYLIAQSFVGFIHLNDYTRERMEQTLESIGFATTPEMYYAMGIAKLGIFVVVGILFSFVMPLFTVVVIVLGINAFYKHLSEPSRILRERREQIEWELPRLTSIIQQELSNGHSAFTIMESYQPFAGELLSQELRITLADMRAGSHESALQRMESRVGSNELSKVIRGLIRSITGDNATQYFEMIGNEFRTVEVNNLRKVAMRNPAKLNKYSFFVLIMSVITIMTVLITYMLQEMPIIF